MTGTAASVGKNARWLAGAQAAKIVIQLVGLGILSRLLGPSDFGVMALAIVVTSLAGLLRDMGTGPAIIRARELSATMVNSIFWVNMAMATAVALLVVVLAVPIASLFDTAPLAHLLYALSLTFPVISFGAAHQALLERESRFHITTRADVLSYTGGLCAAIVAARFGMGAKSLVLQAIVQATLSSLQMFMASPWRPSLSWDASEIRRIFSFSSNLTLSNLVLYLIRNTDSMIVGKTLGAVALGPYSLAFRIMLSPLQNVSLIASKALYPVLSTHQADPERLGATWLESTSFVALITATLMGGLIALCEPFVTVALGQRWGEVARLLPWLAPVGFVQSVLSTAPVIFMVKGRTDVLLKLNIGMAGLHIACWLIGARWGVSGVAAGYLVATIVSAPLYLVTTARLAGLPVARLLRALGIQSGLGISVFTVTFAARSALEPFALPPLALLLVAGLCGGLYGVWHVGRFSPDHMFALRRTFHLAS
ncbi:GumJ protein [Caballeronia glathei]|uniref:Flippase n=1 Tax=Caballeronia glathei TaxID=60547 RepID=A0A069PPB2_9BURK|nr:lipopolysaccharide biosynthesis protein [Caballeronia glathei]KDR42538.1 flippase [Caballeronia glathei]CDY73902.1 GumJ protein [Caballeronia glathei]